MAITYARVSTDARILWRGAFAALVATVLLGLAGPAPAAAYDCGPTTGDDRVDPFCVNAPGTPLVSFTNRGYNNVNFTTEPGERTTCPRTDGRSLRYGATAWFAFHPHVNGILAVQVSGLDAQLVLEEGGGPIGPYPFVCSDDSAALTTGYERIGVGGLVAGRAYLLQIGGFGLTGGGFAESSDIELEVEFAPDQDLDNVPDASDGCPTQAAPGGCPAAPLPPPPVDPDPDQDGVRGAADKCPNSGTEGRDGNRDGCPDRMRQTADVKWRIIPTSGSGVILKELRILQARKGTRIRVRCSRGCRTKSYKLRRSRKTVSARSFGAGRVPPGAKIDVVVTRKGYNGEVHRFLVKPTTMVEKWTRCLPTGRRTPVKGACY